MRKVLGLLLLMISVFVLVSCKDDVDTSIASPKNVTLTEGVLSWSAVSGADSYIVYVDTRPIEVSGTQLDLTQEYILVGQHVITVVAVKGDKQSIPSSAVTYTVVAVSNPENIAAGVLLVFDDSFTPNMTRNDFGSDSEYENYLSTLRMVNAYAEATAGINMTEENAVGLFQDVFDMSFTGMPDNVTGLMDAMEMFDTHQATPYATATILYHMVLVSMEIQLEDEIEYDYGNPEETAAMIEALELNAAITIQSLEMAISFVMDFKNEMSNNVIGLLDQAIEGEEALTTSEIVVIKNEIIGILQDVMPSAADFAFLYSTLMHVGGAITDTDMSSYIVHADYLGQLDHQMITITLEFIKSVDAQTIDDVMEMISELYTYDPYDYYQYYPQVDPVKAVNLVLYILTYIDEFKEDNQVLFDDLDAIMESDSAEALFVAAIDLLIAQAEDDDAGQLTIDLLTSFKDEYDNLKAASEVFMAIGENVISEFIDSEAELILALISLYETTENMTPEQTVDYVIDTLLPMVIRYNNAIFSELDQASILAILNVIKIPVMMTLTNGMGSSMESEMPDFDAILPDVAHILADAITLEMAILNAISTVDITGILGNENLDSMELAAVLAGISVLDAALTTQNANLVRGIVNRIFDNILKNSSIMELHDMSVEDIDAMKTAVLAQVDLVVDEVHAIADFNFNALTPANMERIEAMVEMIEMILDMMDPYENYDDILVIMAEETMYLAVRSSDEVFIEFTPTQSGYYTFASFTVNDGDPYVQLLNSNFYFLTSSDDVNGWDFSLNYNFQAGQTYYFRITTYSSAMFYVSLTRD